jgi:hypothetical protein
MRSRDVRALLAALSPVACACRSAVSGPEGVERAPALSSERLPGVTVTLTAVALDAAPGDTVRFTAAATNGSGARVQLGEACGPVLDVVVTGGGASVSVTKQALGADGAFTCVLDLAYHFAGPGEARTETLSWRVPGRRGAYTAVAGLRRGDGLGNLSAPVTITVR